MISSLTTKDSIAFLGTDQGSVIKVDLNTKKRIETYDSSSKLPIFNLKMVG